MRSAAIFTENQISALKVIYHAEFRAQMVAKYQVLMKPQIIFEVIFVMLSINTYILLYIFAAVQLCFGESSDLRLSSICTWLVTLIERGIVDDYKLALLTNFHSSELKTVLSAASDEIMKVSRPYSLAVYTIFLLL